MDEFWSVKEYWWKCVGKCNHRKFGSLANFIGNRRSPIVVIFRKKPKPRQFFLFNDILVYGNILISKKRYNKQHVIPLEEVQLQDLEDEGGNIISFSFLFNQILHPSTELKNVPLLMKACPGISAMIGTRIKNMFQRFEHYFQELIYYLRLLCIQSF